MAVDKGAKRQLQIWNFMVAFFASLIAVSEHMLISLFFVFQML
jgi:hypothetical protein